MPSITHSNSSSTRFMIFIWFSYFLSCQIILLHASNAFCLFWLDIPFVMITFSVLRLQCLIHSSWFDLSINWSSFCWLCSIIALLALSRCFVQYSCICYFPFLIMYIFFESHTLLLTAWLCMYLCTAMFFCLAVTCSVNTICIHVWRGHI